MHATHDPAPTPPERVLIIRPSALGDVCRSVPVAASLRRAFPSARIDWLVRDSCADAVRHHPAVDRVVLFDRKSLGRAASRLLVGPTLSFLKSLRVSRYDLVIDAQGLFRSGLFALATGAAGRVGYANARELGWLGLNQRVQTPRRAHAVDRMLALVESIGVEPAKDLGLYTSEQDRLWASERILGRCVTLAPTSVWPAKRWPIDRFRKLAELLLQSGHAGQIAVVGAPGERDQCDPLLELAARDERVIDLVGSTSVGRLMAVIERSALVVANDSAAVHMAVGFDRPLVALYGPTSLATVGPYERDHDVVQHVTADDTLDHKSPSLGLPLMQRIQTEEVVRAATDRLSRASARTL
ncbi:MAG: glycosyltransferase family 9 protein [Planctomycetota bacterium]